MVGDTLWHWLIGRFGSMLVTGGGAAALLVLAGVPMGLMLGVATGVLTFIPMIGEHPCHDCSGPRRRNIGSEAAFHFRSGFMAKDTSASADSNDAELPRKKNRNHRGGSSIKHRQP